MVQHVRRWWPEPRLGLVVDGGGAAVALALACVTSLVTMVARLRWDATRSHPPDPQPPGTRGCTPLKGKHQRRWQGWAAHAETPWEHVEGD